MKNDSKKKYWFKRRRYGFGWFPVTWQGFLVLLVGLAIVLVAALQLPAKPAQPAPGQLAGFFGVCAGVIIMFLIVGYTKGPRPRWRWGKQHDDNKDEDI